MADYRVVIAIDYGTSASGYAWALADSTKEDNCCKIKNLGNVNLCAPFIAYGGKDFSIIATDSHGKLIPWFEDEEGAARRNHYIGREVFNLDLTRKDFFVHKRVKMDLYDPESNKQEGINVTESSDPSKIYREIRGEKFYTLDLIAESLRELSQRALEDVRKRTLVQYTSQDALWVVTVPANATQLQKDAMREAARRAGMIDALEADNLIIAFEPEVAAIRIHCDDGCRECFKQYSQNGQYVILIVDAGGGTVDTTAYLCDFSKQDKLVEAGNSHASNAGATYIDQDILAYIATEFFPNFDWDAFQSADSGGYSDLINEITIQKDRFRPEKDAGIRIDVVSLAEYCEDNNIPFNRDKIKRNRVFLPKEEIENFTKKQFDKAIGSIEELARKVGAKYPNVPICYTMVGGFSCSSTYRQLVKERLEPQDVKYVDLNDDNLRRCSVLTGATLYGDDPTMIERRYCKYTFGTSCVLDFDPKLHQGKETFVDVHGNVYAKNAFTAFIKKGDELEDGNFVLNRFFTLRTQNVYQRGQTVEAELDLWEIQDSKIPEFLDDTEKTKEVANYKFDLAADENGQFRYLLRFSVDKTEMRIIAVDCSSGEVVLNEPVHFSSDIWKYGR